MLALVGQRLRRRRLLHRHHEVAGHQKQCAEGDGLAVAEVAVSQEAADQRHEIHQRRVGAVLTLRLPVIEQEMLGHVENQDAAHPVIGKPLPHFGEEQDVQTTRMLTKLPDHRNDGDRGYDKPARNDDIPHALFSQRVRA